MGRPFSGGPATTGGRLHSAPDLGRVLDRPPSTLGQLAERDALDRGQDVAPESFRVRATGVGARSRDV